MLGSILSILTAAGAFGADRVTKHIADNKLPEWKDKKEDPTAFIQFGRARNSGFAGSRLEGHRKLVVTVSLIIFAVCIVMYAMVLSKPASFTMKAGMGLMMGGAAGNVFDRIVNGRVTDFIVMKPFKRIIFNLADVFILIGAVVAALCEMLQGVE